MDSANSVPTKEGLNVEAWRRIMERIMDVRRRGLNANEDRLLRVERLARMCKCVTSPLPCLPPPSPR
jgi:hypothetical protein